MEIENVGCGVAIIRSALAERQPVVTGVFLSHLQELSCGQLRVGYMERTELRGGFVLCLLLRLGSARCGRRT